MWLYDQTDDEFIYFLRVVFSPACAVYRVWFSFFYNISFIKREIGVQTLHYSQMNYRILRLEMNKSIFEKLPYELLITIRFKHYNMPVLFSLCMIINLTFEFQSTFFYCKRKILFVVIVHLNTLHLVNYIIVLKIVNVL